jgi:hypothetical protein
MVITTRKLISVNDVNMILQKRKIKERDIVMNDIINQPRKRIKSPPPPKGSISMNAAGIKYNIHPTTILKWVNKGKVPVIKRTPNCTYVDESAVLNAINNSNRLS